ncbi:MAG: hypothetical protein AAGG48_28880 [Planctomycetota bacterium]
MSNNPYQPPKQQVDRPTPAEPTPAEPTPRFVRAMMWITGVAFILIGANMFMAAITSLNDPTTLCRTAFVCICIGGWILGSRGVKGLEN